MFVSDTTGVVSVGCRMLTLVPWEKNLTLSKNLARKDEERYDLWPLPLKPVAKVVLPIAFLLQLLFVPFAAGVTCSQ